MLDIVLITLGGISVTLGVVGCILPVLPGPVLSFAGLIFLQISSSHPYSYQLLIIYFLLTGFVTILDYIIPIYGTKKLQGSKYGIWGSAAGLIMGAVLFFPAGIVVGPVLGAFIGEIISGRKTNEAFKPAVGSFLGFLTGTIIKLILSLAMAYHFIAALYGRYLV